MIKLLLTLIMIFTVGTSTVSAEENTANIEDIISELAETKLDRQSTINAEVDKLSEDELKTVIANVNKLTEPTEDNLAIKDAAINKLEEIESVETSNEDLDIKEALGINELEEMESVETSDYLTIGLGVVGLILMLSALIMLFMGHRDASRMPLIIGMLLIIVMQLLAK